MKLALILALFASCALGAFTPSLWPLADYPVVNVYTNPVGNDILTNVLLRSRWPGDTNWNLTSDAVMACGASNVVTSRTFGTNTVYYTNTIRITTNIVVTNQFGPVVIGTNTINIPVTAEKLEELTEQLEAKIPYYSLPHYTDTDTFGSLSYDRWFLETSNSFFPAATKLDLFYHTGTNLGRIIDLQTNVLWEGVTMATNGIPYWIKSRNRLNPMGVARWQYGMNYGMTVWPTMVYDYGNPPNITNEFYMLEYGTPLPTRSTLLDRYVPIVIIYPANTNVVYGGEITYGDPDQGAVTMTHSNGVVEDIWGSQIPLTSLTNVFPITNTVAVSAMLTGVSTNFPTVLMTYTGNMTTYEGTEVWSKTLLPETMDAHYFAMTNLYLTPWDNWYWTNGIFYTNAAVAITNYAMTNVYISTQTDSVHVVTVDTMGWRQPLGWFRGCEGPWFPTNYNLPVDPNLGGASNVTGIPSKFTYAVNFGVSLDEEFTALTCFQIPQTNPPFTDLWTPSWGVLGTRTDSLSWTYTGESVVSSIAIHSLYTGTPHRAHIYLNYDFDTLQYDSDFYHRVQVTSWTNSETIISDPIDLTTNLLEVMVALPKTCGGPSDGPIMGGIIWKPDGHINEDLPATNISYTILQDTNNPVSSNSVSYTNWCILTYTNYVIGTNVTGTNVLEHYTIIVTDLTGTNVPDYSGSYEADINTAPPTQWLQYDAPYGFIENKYLFDTIGNPLYEWVGDPPTNSTDGQYWFEYGPTVTNYVTEVVTSAIPYEVTNQYVETFTTNVYASTIITNRTPRVNTFSIATWRAYMQRSCGEDVPLSTVMTNYTLVWRDIRSGEYAEFYGTNTLVESVTVTNCDKVIQYANHTVSLWGMTNSPEGRDILQVPLSGDVPTNYTECEDAFFQEDKNGNSNQVTHPVVNYATNFLYTQNSVITGPHWVHCQWGEAPNYYFPWSSFIWGEASGVTPLIPPDGENKSIALGGSGPWWTWFPETEATHATDYYVPGWLYGDYYTLKKPCDKENITVGWLSQEHNYQSGATNLVGENISSVLVLIEWKD